MIRAACAVALFPAGLGASAVLAGSVTGGASAIAVDPCQPTTTTTTTTTNQAGPGPTPGTAHVAASGDPGPVLLVAADASAGITLAQTTTSSITQPCTTTTSSTSTDSTSTASTSTSTVSTSTVSTGTTSPAPDTVAPALSKASVRPKTFAVDRTGPSKAPVAATTKGTTFRYSLSEPARVVFSMKRRTTGRRVGGKCRKQTRSNRRKRRCTLYATVGRFAERGAAGANRNRFSGKIGRRRLRPGRHRAELVARDSAGNRSRLRTLTFTVVRR